MTKFMIIVTEAGIGCLRQTPTKVRGLVFDDLYDAETEMMCQFSEELKKYSVSDINNYGHILSADYDNETFEAKIILDMAVITLKLVEIDTGGNIRMLNAGPEDT